MHLNMLQVVPTPLSLACSLNKPEFVPLLLPYTDLTMQDFSPKSLLFNIVPQCDSKIKKDFLIKALECYVTERKKEVQPFTDILHFFGFGYSEEAKIKAAIGLLNHLKNPKNTPLDSSFVGALKNGRLGTLYHFYNTHKDHIKSVVIEKDSGLGSKSSQDKPSHFFSSQKALKSELINIKTIDSCISEENETECRLIL